MPLDRPAALDRFRRARARTRAMFDLIDDAAYYERPIPLRNPAVFYEGHLPAFAINTLVKKALRRPGIDDELETIFARGIDPETEATAIARGNPAWPSRGAVQAYAAAADRVIEQAIAGVGVGSDPIHGSTQGSDPTPTPAEALWTILEHEDMHQETLAYIWHQLPYERKRKPAIYVTAPPRLREAPAPRRVKVPAGVAVLGTAAEQFGWDNERPLHHVEVPAFEVDAYNVTNADYLAFVEREGAAPPAFWERHEGTPSGRPAEAGQRASHGGSRRPATRHSGESGGEWFLRGMFERVPLPGAWPVYVTWEEADAYARWSGARLMTEAEWHRAAEGATPGNCDFKRWDPEPVGCRPDTASTHGVHDLIGNGWEWTSTVFAPFEGFQAMASYPEYSADFFDGEHYVLKGASPVTPKWLVRPGFRNWFRPRYPYVYATFRCARDA